MVSGTLTRQFMIVAAVALGSSLLVTPAAAEPLGAAGSASVAVAAGDGSTHRTLTDGRLTAEVYSCAGAATQTYTVPAGVTSLYLEAAGGEGSTPDAATSGYGGRGGETSGSLQVSAGQEFDVQVGCAGGAQGGASPYAPGGERGTGWSDISVLSYSFGYDGGAGGGATAVLSGGQPVMVAGGGGGAGGDAPDCIESATDTDQTVPAYFFYCNGSPMQQGGNGGDGNGSAGGIGQLNPAPATAGGAECGVTPAGRAGSDFDQLGGGGAGGGGGGGVRGGCGGAAGQAMALDPTNTAPNNGQAGNGGGGGSSYVASSVQGARQAVADVAGDGYVLFLTSTDEVRTTDFGYTGGEQRFCVPDGVDQLFAEVQGGAGAGGGPDFPGVGTGGSGSGIRAVLDVTERHLLRVAVGGYGGADGGWGDGHGGARGEGEDAVVKDGAGGGGSSAVQQSSASCGDPNLSELSDLIVAGGGGGGGGNGFIADGGGGGNAGLEASDGQDGDNPNGGPGGQGGGASDRTGGNGTDSTTGGGGGGGGGGLNGGGTGHAPHDGEDGGGGGGGGGQSFIAPSASSISTYLGPDGNQSVHGDGHVRLIVPVPSTRSAVSVVSGSDQTALPGQELDQPLVFRYVDALTDVPVVNIPIRMSVVADGPAPATLEGSAPGESVVLSTDANGEVEVFARAQEDVPVASYVVRAERDDDPAHLIGVAEARVFNVGWPTAVTLTSDDGTQPPEGATPTYTATVTSPQRGSSAVTEGAVQFSIDGVALGGPVDLDANGSAVSPEAPPLAAGPHHVLANYSDGSGQNVDAFTSLGQSVRTSVETSLALSSSAANPVEGDPVTFTATLTSPLDTGRYDGTVTFAVNGVDVTAPVSVESDGHASSGPIELPFPAELGVGGAQLFQITASYSGDTSHLPATGGMSQSMRWATDLTAFASPIIAREGEGITITGTILGSWPTALYPPHTGTMQLFLGDQALTSPFPLSDALTGTSPAVTNLSAGIHEITLAYSGDSNYGPATSAVVHVMVLPFDAASPPTATVPPKDDGSSASPPSNSAPTGENLAATGFEPVGAGTIASVLLVLGLLAFRRATRKREPEAD